MGKQVKKRKTKANAVVAQYVRPTEAREAHNDFQSAGMAMRVIPVIDTLRKSERITQAEYDALNHYREQAHKAEDDCAECSTLAPERIMGGGGTAPGSKIPVGVLLATPAIIECGRLERELGSLLDIARAVAVDDWTLERWCIEKHGGLEVYRTVTGKDGKPTQEFVAVVPRNPHAVEMARLELRYAAGMIAR